MPAKKGCWLQKSAPLSAFQVHELGDIHLAAPVKNTELFLRVLSRCVLGANLCDLFVGAFCTVVSLSFYLSTFLVTIAHVFGVGAQPVMLVPKASAVIAAMQHLPASRNRTVSLFIDRSVRQCCFSFVPGQSVAILGNVTRPNQARTQFRAMRRGRPLRGMIQQALHGALSFVHAFGHSHLVN